MSPYPNEHSSDVDLIRDVQYGEAAGEPLWMDIARPKRNDRVGSGPAIVYFHGGAWRSGSKGDGRSAICHLAQHGFLAASVGYRLSGRAKFPAQIEDCKCAVRFLRANAARYRLDPDRIGAMGVSSGGHLAILLGLTGDGPQFANHGGSEEFSNQVAAVCELFSPVDFLKMPKSHLPDAVSATAQLLGASIEQDKGRYIAASPVTYVHSSAPPFLIVHGDADSLVPVGQSELLRDALKKAGVDVTLHIVKGAGHGSREVMTPVVRGLIVDFFDRQLKSAAQSPQ